MIIVPGCERAPPAGPHGVDDRLQDGELECDREWDLRDDEDDLAGCSVFKTVLECFTVF